MKRSFIGIVTGFILVLFLGVPALAASDHTFSGGTWTLESDYRFNINSRLGWEDSTTLELVGSGQQWAASVKDDDGTWQARFGLATADQWTWDGMDETAEVDIWDLDISYDHSIIGSLGLGFDIDTDFVDGEDMFGRVSLFSAGMRVGPVLDHEARMLLGTWILKGYAQAGPTIQVLDDGNHEPYTYCGLSTQWGAEVGYLLFNFIGVSAGVSQRYDLSPWGQEDGDSASLAQHDYYIRGMLRF